MREIQAALREQATCATCGKTRVVLNLADYRRPFSIERVTPATHCTCPPRFTEDGGRYAEGPAWELVTDACPNVQCDHGQILELVDGYPERTVCAVCEGLGRVPRPHGEERAS